MDSSPYDLLCGILKCAFGLMLVLSGIIGWPTTKRILGLLTFPATRRTHTLTNSDWMRRL